MLAEAQATRDCLSEPRTPLSLLGLGMGPWWMNFAEGDEEEDELHNGDPDVHHADESRGASLFPVLLPSDDRLQRWDTLIAGCMVFISLFTPFDIGFLKPECAPPPSPSCLSSLRSCPRSPEIVVIVVVVVIGHFWINH